MTGDYISMGAGLALLVISAMVMKAYWPRRGEPRDAAFFLSLAIFLGFASDAANTLWWQVIVGSAAHYGWADYTDLRRVGLFLDGLLKGGATFAGVLHLVSLQKALKQPNNYRWFDMPFHPKRLTLRNHISREDDG